MARNPKNKFPADRSGTKYAEFRNTRRIPAGKVKATASKPAPADTPPAATENNAGS